MKQITLRRLCFIASASLLFAAPSGAQTVADQPSVDQSTWGLSASAAVSGAPVGQLAERAGLVAVPGAEYGLRVVRRGSSASEWSVGFVADVYRVDQEISERLRFTFDYASTALVAGYAHWERQGGTLLLFGVDVGWRWFEASSTVPNYYTGEVESSRARGGAVLAGVSFGVEVPLRSAVLVPRLRLETNYPDVGGGDGYSGLHRRQGLGFRASVGVDLKWWLGR